VLAMPGEIPIICPRRIGMRTKLNRATTELWVYSLTSQAIQKLLSLKAHLPIFCQLQDGRRIYIIPEILADKIVITVLYRPLRALLLPDRLADVEALKDDLQTPAWRKICRGYSTVEFTKDGIRFISSEASVRSKKHLAHPSVARIPSMQEIIASLESRLVQSS